MKTNNLEMFMYILIVESYDDVCRCLKIHQNSEVDAGKIMKIIAAP